MLDKELLLLASSRVFNYQDWLIIKNENLSPKEILQDLSIIKFLFGKKKYHKFREHLSTFPLDKEFGRLAAAKIHLITPLSSDYPLAFREISQAPPVLYYKGNVKLLNQLQLGVIGSRQPTPYSYHCVNSLLNTALLKNVVITSGLAKGIDAAAHYRALELGGATIAVLGYGLLSPIYPRENQALFQKILENNGLIISEYYPDTPPLAAYFVQRNRIIAALSDKVLIIAATQKSGSLITANYALDFNKDVLVCPGPISCRNFQGSHELLKQGAALVSSNEDLLASFNFLPMGKNKNHHNNFTIEEILVLQQLYEPLNFYDLLSKTKLDNSRLSQTLLLLESKKMIIKKGLYYHH